MATRKSTVKMVTLVWAGDVDTSTGLQQTAYGIPLVKTKDGYVGTMDAARAKVELARENGPKFSTGVKKEKEEK